MKNLFILYLLYIYDMFTIRSQNTLKYTIERNYLWRNCLNNLYFYAHADADKIACSISIRLLEFKIAFHIPLCYTESMVCSYIQTFCMNAFMGVKRSTRFYKWLLDRE